MAEETREEGRDRALGACIEIGVGRAVKRESSSCGVVARGFEEGRDEGRMLREVGRASREEGREVVGAEGRDGELFEA